MELHILENMQPRGFTCVGILITAYQVEELHDTVYTIEEFKNKLSIMLGIPVEQLGNLWPSDKRRS